MLRFMAGLTGPEIAARTGLTHGSVRVNLHRGVEMLRKKLGEGTGRA
jgi:RNA polymerase sigma-70 factor (ECF subfamily)